MLLRAIALAVFLVPSAAVGRTPEPPLKPRGDWVVETGYGGACVLYRDYGDTQHSITLWFSQIPTESTVTMRIHDAPGKYVRSLSAWIGVGADTPVQYDLRSMPSYPLNGQPRSNVSTGLDRAVLQNAAASGGFWIDTQAGYRRAFILDGLEGGLERLSSCLTDTLERWGLSRDQQARTSKFPEPHGRKTIQMNVSYPLQAYVTRDQGDALAYVRVDQLGKPHDCKVPGTAGNKFLDQTACDLLIRTKYEPALDTAGQPIDSLFALKVAFRL